MLQLPPSFCRYLCGLAVTVRFLSGLFGSSKLFLKLVILRPRTSSAGIRGSVQQGVILPDLRKLPVPNFSDRLVDKVEAAVFKARYAAQQAVTLYPEAEVELLDRLGWAQLAKQPRELSYNADFSALVTAGRSDAEFYQPHCRRLRDRIQQAGGKMISEFCPQPRRGVQPEFAEHGTVLALDSKSVRPHGVEPGVERITQAFYDSDSAANGRVRPGDVLLNSTGRGTIGRAAWYQLVVPALCDNHVAILRPDPKVCHPGYLALFLNSPAGLTQSEQFQTGSSGQLEIYPQHIQRFLIYLPRTKAGAIDLTWQEKLAAKVETATHARDNAKTKLGEAKRLLEEALTN
jgi:type I restriction enzyme, S subunit